MTVWRHVPNLITVARILAVAPLLWLIGEKRYGAALILGFIAGASDGLDGFLAKRFGWASRLGSILDPAADKLLLVGSFFMLWLVGLVPLWLFLVVFARDLMIVVGVLILQFRYGRVEMRPTRISKINTAVQIAFVVLLLWFAAGGSVPPRWPLAESLLAVTTVLSGAQYVSLGVRKLSGGH